LLTLLLVSREDESVNTRGWRGIRNELEVQACFDPLPLGEPA
jgi:hypothetical protein